MTKKNWYELRNALFEREYELASRLLQEDPGLIAARDGLGETVLHHLAVENELAGVEWLCKRGAALNTKNDFGTPVIFEVAQLGYKELFLWFLQNGADAFCRDGEDQDLLAYLREYEKEDMVQFALENVPNIALHATPASGRA